MRHTILLITATLFLFTIPCAYAADEVYMSEYVEGADIKSPDGAFDKVIELFNPSIQFPVPLEAYNYMLWIFADGATEPTYVIPLTGIIDALGTYIIAHPSADPAILAVADQLSADLLFDGNDAVILMFYNPRADFRQIPTYLDIIGQVGIDPPAGCWCHPQPTCICTDPLSTLDGVLRATAGPLGGSVDPLAPFEFDPTVWSGYPPEDLGGLGLPGSVPVELLSFIVE